MKSLEINDHFINILAALYYKIIRKNKKEHKGIFKLLSILGNPKEILDEYKKNSEQEKSTEPHVYNKKYKNKKIAEENATILEEKKNIKEKKKNNKKSRSNSPKNNQKNVNKKTSKIFDNENIEENSTQNNDFTNEFLIIENEIPENRNISKILKSEESLNEEEINIMNKYGLSLKNGKKNEKKIEEKRKIIKKNVKEENFDAGKAMSLEESLNEEELDIMKKYGLSLKNKKKKEENKNKVKKTVHRSLNDLTLHKLKKDQQQKLLEKDLINQASLKPAKQKRKLLNISLFNKNKSEEILENLFENENLSICSINDYEKKDLESIEIMNKKHEHFFKNAFAKYANSTNVDRYQNFRPSEEKNITMSISDLRKMLKEFDLDTFIKKDVQEFIFNKINTNILAESKRKPLDYDSFLNYFLIMSKYIFIRAPFEMSDVPLGLLIEELVNLIWKIAVERNNKPILLLFSKNNKQNIRLRILNNILRENPDSELPDVLFLKFVKNF